jgi:hypothetical protein
MSVLIFSTALVLTGITAGIYVSTLIHDHRIDDLYGVEYMAMHQMRDKTYRVVMPPFRLVTLALVGGAAYVAQNGLAQWLAAASAALIVIDIVLTVKLQVPLNRTVQSWTASTIPANWAEIRDRWDAGHNLRLVLALASFICVVAATMLTRIA